MRTSEKRDIHELMVNNILNTLAINGENVKPSDNDCADFMWDNHGCKVFAHKLVGHNKSIVMEYATDRKINKQIGAPVSIFIDYENPDKFYKINTTELYNFVNACFKNNSHNVHLVNTGDVLKNTGDVLKNTGLCVGINFNSFLSMNHLNIYNMESLANKLAIKYEPLVNKITRQFFERNLMPWNDIKSMAYEGLAIAINTYDEEKSTMSFTQFAAFAIRNNILTSIDNELRTVKMSAYAQKKATEAGDALFTTVRIQQNDSDDERKTPQEIKLGMYEDAKFEDGDVYEYLYSRIDDEFSVRDCEIFYRTFGLKGYDDEKCVDLAKEYKLSVPSISVINKKIIKFIKHDTELCEILSKLV